ncbi:MAG: heavy-metal-associated domain-containing protein [Candidatus Micrarchaeota archaeon]
MIARFSVDKIHCQSCKALIEDELSDLGADSDVDVGKKEVTVEFDEGRIRKERIIDVLSALGYVVEEIEVR